jgi:hypothetical protein
MSEVKSKVKVAPSVFAEEPALPALPACKSDDIARQFLEDANRDAETVCLEESLSHAISPMESLRVRNNLLKANNADMIARELKKEFKPVNSLEKMVLDQCAALHVAAMVNLAAATDSGHADYRAPLNKATMKIFECFQNSISAFSSLREGKNQTITVKHQSVQVNGGQNIIADKVVSKREGGE